MMRKRLQLDYRLSAGRLAPWADALSKGRALGRRCDGCRRVSFPPLRRCTCGSDEASWQELSGEAEIVHRTAGQEEAFALVRFEGADTLAVVRLADIGEGETRGYLTPQADEPADAPPALILSPNPYAGPA